jgi:hypothetical protein
MTQTKYFGSLLKIVLGAIPLSKLPWCPLTGIALPSRFVKPKIFKHQITVACLNVYKNLDEFTQEQHISQMYE